MKEPGAADQTSVTSPVSGSKEDPDRPRPVIEIPAPIAPGTAQVMITITKIMPVSGGASCTSGACKAEAKVEAVEGYGSGFQQAFGTGQIIQLYFPVGMVYKEEGDRKVEVQDRMEVNLMAPEPEGGSFTVNSFSRVK